MKQRLIRGDTVYGSFVTNPGWDGYIEILKYHGYDCVLIDTEHSPAGYERLERLLRTARLSDIHPIVRVNEPDYSLIARAMDMGCHSVMLPRVENGDQARRAVEAAKYPPLGRRGAGGYLTLFEPDKLKYLQNSNAQGMVIVQIESGGAIGHLDEIVRVEHIDVVFIGPFDLSVDLGIPGEMSHPLLREAMDEIVSRCKARSIPTGIHMGNMQELIYWKNKGVQLLSLASDISAMFTGSLNHLKMVRG